MGPMEESLLLPIVWASAARNLLLGLILWPRYWPVLGSWNSLNNPQRQATPCVPGTVLGLHLD